jgi:hypothetical protein
MECLWMDAKTALQNAARQYCFDIFSAWGRKLYDGVVPQIGLLHAILADVETISPSDCASSAEMRQMLLAAGETAQDECRRNLSKGQLEAVEVERRRFCRFVEALDEEACMDRPQFPFRRVLRRDETKRLYELLVRAWGKWYGGYGDREDIPPHVTLHTDGMKDPGAYGALRNALRDRNITQIIELREFGRGYELDIDMADFQYDGAEGFWLDGSLEWMVAASHESSITFGGEWLITAMRQRIPQFTRYIYKGWPNGLY